MGFTVEIEKHPSGFVGKTERCSLAPRASWATSRRQVGGLRARFGIAAPGGLDRPDLAEGT
jgi:hypothetical protein